MITIKDKSKCSGCTACMAVCPKKAISMVEDSEGFLYPKIDKEKCINCGLCEKKCPILNVQYKELNKYPEAFLCYSSNVKERINSASGGAFFAIAKNFLTKPKSAVIGAAYDDNNTVHHIIAKDSKDLLKLQKSKYVQSKMDNIFRECIDLLKDGYKVLFSGTGCQIEGIKKITPSNLQDNLYTIDVICYGVPSPKVFKKYIEYQEKNNGPIEKVIIRDKKIYHKLHRVGYGILFNNGKKYFQLHGSDPMARLFYGHYCLRPVCYRCPFKKLGRNSDITLGDCWYADRYIKNYKDKYGITLTITNSEKGKQLMNESSDIFKIKIDYEEAVRINGGMLYSTAIKPINREKFFEDFNSDMYTFDELADKYVKQKKESIKDKIKFKIRDYGLIPNCVDFKRKKNINNRLKKKVPDESRQQIL